jgi:hypothetical protein
MLTRKQFLQELFLRGICVLASLDDASRAGSSSRDSDSLIFNELNPSLLKIEAERMGIDPSHVDEADLRDRIYAALDKECRRRSDLSILTKTERSEKWNDLERAI